MKTDLKPIKIEITYEGGLVQTIGPPNANALLKWIRDRFHKKWEDGNHLDDALQRYPLRRVDAKLGDV